MYIIVRLDIHILNLTYIVVRLDTHRLNVIYILVTIDWIVIKYN